MKTTTKSDYQYLIDDNLDEDLIEEAIELGIAPNEVEDYISLIDGGMDKEVIEAAIECDVQLCNVEEAYQGEYRSDEDFAEDFAEQLGFEYPNTWPNNCIDWEHAAKELMYDYSESNGYYFRNF